MSTMSTMSSSTSRVGASVSTSVSPGGMSTSMSAGSVTSQTTSCTSIVGASWVNATRMTLLYMTFASSRRKRVVAMISIRVNTRIDRILPAVSCVEGSTWKRSYHHVRAVRSGVS